MKDTIKFLENWRDELLEYDIRTSFENTLLDELIDKIALLQTVDVNQRIIPSHALEKNWKENYPEGMSIQDVNNELADYEFLLENVPKVYQEISGGLLSYPNYPASVVISKYNDHIQDHIKEVVLEDFKESEEYIELLEDYNTYFNEPGMDENNPKPKLYVEYLESQEEYAKYGT
jgi:hypothetical protein